MNTNPPSENQTTESTKASLDLLYRVSRELATALDLPTVLQRVLSLSIDTIGATSGSIIILDEQEQPVESAIIYEDQVLHHTTEQLKSTLEKGLAGWVVQNKEAAYIADTREDDRWLFRLDDEETASGAKSVVAVPIKARENLVGVITVTHPIPNYLTEDHLALVQAIADQAGVAVLNARLYDGSKRQARVMTALANSAMVISSTLNLDQVLKNILIQIKKALQVDAIALALIDKEKNELEYKAVKYDKPSMEMDLIGQRVQMGEGLIGWVARNGKGMTIKDLKNNPHYPAISKLHSEINLQSIACAPIRLHGSVIGVLEAINPKGEDFEEDALLVLSGIGSLAGSSIQNAQLFEDLQAAHNRYHDLFENSADPIIITDFQGSILESNYRTLKTTGYTQKELHSLSVRDLHKIDWESVGRDFDSLATGETCTYESTLVKADQTDIPIQVNVHPINIAGQPRLEWILRDITERKKLDQLREDLTSMVYHDLRSPLSNVVSSLDVLEALLPVEKDEEIKSLFDIATRSTQRIQRLTKSLLDINRLEKGQPITAQEPIKPYLLAESAYQAMIPHAMNKEQDLSINVPKDLPVVMADRDMIERVLINLLENAIKFTPPQGAIEVGAETDQENIRFWVHDTGPGIDPDQKDKIFDKFIRLDTNERVKGLGLGLAFCRLAVEGHGGKISVETPPEGGSLFYFTLPLTPSPEET
ncbi:MAG: GAF domain-containing protein [Anaerolineales bacterium]